MVGWGRTIAAVEVAKGHRGVARLWDPATPATAAVSLATMVKGYFQVASGQGGAIRDLSQSIPTEATHGVRRAHQ